ncbi:MAG: hypothetical protein DGJ47_000908 [Rickettsiaceae bacterium]
MDKIIKQNLSYAYQIIAKLGLDDHTYTHLSARPKGANYYYILPFGLRFSEVTADSLLKVSLDGEILEGGEESYNKTGYIIHSTIYKARPEINSIFHLHTIASVAVSAMKDGLLPISQWALHFYDDISYYDYNSLALDKDIYENDIMNALQDNKVMFFRNHGFITCGNTIEEAMFYCHHLEYACKTQVSCLSMQQEIIQPNHDICIKTKHDLLNFEKNLGERDWKAWLRYIEK